MNRFMMMNHNEMHKIKQPEVYKTLKTWIQTGFFKKSD